MIADGLDLHHRLAHSWERCREGHVPVWVAPRLARSTRELGSWAATFLDERFARQCVALPPGRQLRLIDALVIEADPARAARKELEARQARFVRVRNSGDGGALLFGRLDLLEAFPGSERRSVGLDQDHTDRFTDAPVPCGCAIGEPQTSPANLAPLSRRAHRAKTAGLWSVSQTDPGHLFWTSPLGLRYAVTPSGTFRVEPEAARAG